MTNIIPTCEVSFEDCPASDTEIPRIGGIRNMDSRVPPSNISSFNSDWNSNQFHATQKKTDQKALDDSIFEPYTNNTRDNCNRDYSRKSPTSTASSPTSVFGASLHQKDISYDDLSKNIDANLAEIDMETFRSEDINSILALPAIYSGDFQSASHGEQCASVSGSLLNGLELDTSASNRHSEDEISICKDEPLFSPLREPPVPASTISVDSLDNSSSYDQDLVLTCKANKNNYTIVFEGSSTQFSDDSDYQDICRSSEAEGTLPSAVQVNYSSSFKKQSSMVQSDVAFTTWSKLWRSQRMSRRRSDASTKISSKSQSLPNLSHNSVFITDKQLTQWAKWCGNQRFPLYEVVQNYQATGLHVAGSKECLHSVSLLKMFMRHRVSSSSSIGSSGQSDSSSSLILQPLNYRNNSSLQNSLNISDNRGRPYARGIEDVTQQNNQQDKNRGTRRNENETLQTQMYVDNIQILDWNSVQNLAETNNNNINSLYTNDNIVPDNNNVEEIATHAPPGEECDNSQYFEDSLMDAPSPPLKHFHATPIKEEEETDISSGDEVMRDSKNPFGSDESSSGEITVIQNNALEQTVHANRQEGSHNLERINNIFPSCKSNVVLASEAFSLNNDGLSTVKSGVPTENHSQSTQTKVNINDCTTFESFKPLHTFSCKTSSNQTDCDTNNVVHYTTSRDSSPASSGYVSSRHSSVERLRHSSQSINHNATAPVATQRSNVFITTTCTCGTQIPVHVKDTAVQTSTLYNPNTCSGFTLKESTSSLPEPNITSQTKVKLAQHTNSTSQTKPKQKDKKSVYVCYPNYSLPDLSFLKSIIEENAESVFLAPAEYKLPQEILNQKRPARPKSYGAYETLLEKHLTKIKDWESLNVLLPDDLKLLISKTHPKSAKGDTTSHKDVSFIKNRYQSLSSSYCNADDATKLKTNFSDTNYKRHMPRSILRKSSSVEQCEDRQCRVHLPTRCTSASSVLGNKYGGSSPDGAMQHARTTGFSEGATRNFHWRDFKCPEYGGSPKVDINSKKYQQHDSKHSSAKSPEKLHLSAEEKKNRHCTSFKSISPLHMHHPDIVTAVISSHDKKSSYPMNSCQDENLMSEFSGKNSPYLFNDENMLQSFEHKKTGPPNTDAQMNCLQHSKKAVKFCERSPTKSSKHLEACKMGRCFSCDPQSRSPGDFHNSECSCDICNLDSEKPPQEFLVSPTQNSLLYPEISDSYTLQNFSGGGKFFQEALRRKTGLVENLRKATQILFEHYKSGSDKKGSTSCGSFSTGQKILTWLCPAVHTILSDGLLPSVQGFFGPLPNSPWKVAGASIKQGETRKDVEDLLNHVNSEKLLTDSTYRFNAFIIGLLNLGCFEWWLGHLCACQSLICHHYHPTALLSLLALPAAVHLRHELKELVSPLSNIPFSLDIMFETKITSGDWKKCSEDNLRPSAFACESEKVSKADKYMTNLNLQFSPYKHQANKINDFSLKTKHSQVGQVLSPCNNVMNIRSDAEDCHDNQVWPGITINPFPNAKFAEEYNAAPATSQNKSQRSQARSGGSPSGCYRNSLATGETGSCLASQSPHRKATDVPHFSLCSSTDSGCSSQLEHGNSPVATNNTTESPNVNAKEKDGQQFKMLRQKWEKISHGINKQAMTKSPSGKVVAAKPTTPTSVRSKKKPEISPTRPVTASTIPKTPTKSVNQTNKKMQSKMSEARVVSPKVAEVVSPEGEKGRRSQIPMLKFGKGPQVRSMIPVQRMGARAKSANRDLQD